MARTPKAAHTFTSSVRDLMKAVGSLATSVQGAIANSPEVKAAAVELKDVAKVKGRRLKKAVRSYWSELKDTPRNGHAAGVRRPAKSR